MSALSNYLENALLNHVLKNTVMTQPASLNVALFTTDPTDAGTGTEVAGNGYARRPVTFGVASNGSASNNADVLFAVATGSWGTITHIGIYDAATGGNLLWHGALSTSKAIAINDQFKIASGNLTVSLD
jgi:hypothetical protein